MSEEAIAAALMIENKNRCNPPLPESEILTIAKSVSKYRPPAPQRDNDTYNSYVYSGQDEAAYSNRDKTVTETVTKDRVLGWVRDTTGWITVASCIEVESKSVLSPGIRCISLNIFPSFRSARNLIAAA